MNKLKQAILDSGLKQQYLADQLDINANTITRWINGVAQPRVDQAQRLAQRLDVSVESLFPLSKERHEQPNTSH